MELKNVESLKGVFIQDLGQDDDVAWAKDIQQRLSSVRIKVDRSIPELINLYDADNPMIQLMGFERADTWIDKHGNICIIAWNHIFELQCYDENGVELYKLANVYQKCK